MRGPRAPLAPLAASLALVGAAAIALPARADVTLLRSDTWEVFTTGRVDGFFSYGFGDANPIPLMMNEQIPQGGGVSVNSDGMPRFAPDGVTHIQGTFQSMRLRSGFVPNVFGFGMRRRINDDTTLKVYIALWATIESDGQRKTNPVTTDAREGYLKVEGPWGSVLAGRALDLFSRGATENDFLYGHGYGLGFPGNIDGTGPAAGLINFGVMAAFFSPGLVYATPSLGGVQLSAGIYDPTPLQGTFEGTRWARPEGELTYDLRAGSFKMHLFGNGEYQKVYLPGSNTSGTSWGVGYGGRFEVGPVHLGLAGHYGPGLGLGYALEPGSISVSQQSHLRTFDGYSAILQLSHVRFDVNAGAGVSRTYALPEDEDPNMPVSVPKQQLAVFAAFVWHFTDYLAYDVDALSGQTRWYFGESQRYTFINTGLTAVW
ncbi:MAG TPA: porin [Polyangia bacterium]|nr:porin [Polyangia bacterium]